MQRKVAPQKNVCGMALAKFRVVLSHGDAKT